MYLAAPQLAQALLPASAPSGVDLQIYSAASCLFSASHADKNIHGQRRGGEIQSATAAHAELSEVLHSRPRRAPHEKPAFMLSYNLPPTQMEECHGDGGISVANPSVAFASHGKREYLLNNTCTAGACLKSCMSLCVFVCVGAHV